MRPERGHGADLGDGPQEPLEKVHGVDALVHQAAAAVQLPRAAPGARVVVGLIAVPLDRRAAEGDGAETASIQGAFEGKKIVREAAREDPSQEDAGLVGGGNDPVAAPEGDLEGFLDQKVLAGLRGGHGGLEVKARGRGDRDDPEAGMGEETVEIGVGGAPVLGGEPRRVLGHRVVAGQKADAAHVAQSLGVKIGDDAAPDDAEADGLGCRHALDPPRESRLSNRRNGLAGGVEGTDGNPFPRAAGALGRSERRRRPDRPSTFPRQRGKVKRLRSF